MQGSRREKRKVDVSGLEQTGYKREYSSYEGFPLPELPDNSLVKEYKTVRNNLSLFIVSGVTFS